MIFGTIVVVFLQILLALSSGSAEASDGSGAGFHGFIKNETAYRIHTPSEFTKIKNILFVHDEGNVTSGIGYKVTGRAYYDAVFDLTDTYGRSVEQSQEDEIELRDTYLDFSSGGFDLRVGKQQIVWGEAVGLFFADMVNPKDFREFILPDFDQIRIPLWSADMEYYYQGTHMELVWIPILQFNDLGTQGSEFEFARPSAPAGTVVHFEDEKKPSNDLRNSGVGARLSRSLQGWDLSGFYFYGYDYFPAFFRRIALDPSTSQTVVTFRPEYTRLNVFGLTFAKEVEDVIVKGEFVYNKGKCFQVADTTHDDGVVKKDFLDSLIGVDYTFFQKVDFNVQLMQRIIFGHEYSMIDSKTDTSFSVWLKTGLLDNTLEPELFLVSSLSGRNAMFRPKVSYTFQDKWVAVLGVDIFDGRQDGTFGQFDSKDRAYIELRHDF